MNENNPQAPQGQQVQVKVTDQVLAGVYANMMQIGHTQEEFVLDFMNIFPPQGIGVARVFINPSHMKRIAAAMEDNVKRYEAQFGEIKAGNAPAEQSGFGFRTE